MLLAACSGPAATGPATGAPIPVQVGAVETGTIEARRTFSGTLEARDAFTVAPRIGGRIARMRVDMADTVQRGDVVAELDDEEYRQAVAQAEADLRVAEARLTEAANALEIAVREAKRLEALRLENIVSESQLDRSHAERLAREGELAVADAQAVRAHSALESATIRLGYTKVHADWSGGDRIRVVADRYADEGSTVAANTPLVSVVSLDAITGVIFVAQRDYAGLSAGQSVEVRTDAHGDREFAGRVSRVSPVFRQSSRQARVEIAVDNAARLLRPGMFIRADIVLDRADNATIVPMDALVTRDGRQGVFVVGEDGAGVRWRGMQTGIRDGQRVQILGEPLAGRVVTLGQQFLADGSRVVVTP